MSRQMTGIARSIASSTTKSAGIMQAWMHEHMAFLHLRETFLARDCAEENDATRYT